MLRKCIIGIFKVYQYGISPLKGPTCRFYPSCSEYAIEAVQEHGAIRGVYLGAKRLIRCSPLCEGGVDLVPPKKKY